MTDLGTMEAVERARDFLIRRSHYYKLCYGTPAGEAVLKDLARYCKATDSAYQPSQRETDIILGRQQVWLRIARHLKLTPDQLYQLYAGARVQQGDSE